MYLSNFSLSKCFIKSLKKYFAIMYKIKAPIEIDNNETKVPIHFPKNIPDIIKIGDPKPSRITQIIAKSAN